MKRINYYHIVQTDKEEALVQSLGGHVILNIQSVVRNALKEPLGPYWSEPEDMREVTGFSWSPIHADRYLPNFPSEIRSRIAGAIQQAVSRIFSQRHYDGFLSEPVALFLTHLLFYHSLKANTRPLFWSNTYFSKYFYFSDKIETSSPVRRKPMVTEEINSLRQDVLSYAVGVASDTSGPIYHHSFSGTKTTLLSYFRQRAGASPLVLRPGMLSRLIQVGRLSRVLYSRIFFKHHGDFITAGALQEHSFFARCLFAPDSIYDRQPVTYSSNNVVYPLQYEPEASLLYFAPHHMDQVSFVKTILRALPHGKILWVKEHPNQFGALNEAIWLNLRKHHENIRFIHGRQSGRELIKKSALVVTISSSMGLDALLLGRKVLVGGEVFYSRFTGAIRVDGYNSLSKELNNDANYTGSNNFDANVEELVVFGSRSYPGDPQPSHYLFSDTNLNLLSTAILEELGVN